MAQDIPTYPNFVNLSINHKKTVDDITAQFEPYSDFGFNSLFCWNIHNNIRISNLKGGLVISLPDYLDSDKKIHSIIGRGDLRQPLTVLLNNHGRLDLVPEVVIANLGSQEGFRISEDRDSFDYVYSATKLASLAGGDYKKKRNKANRFLKNTNEQKVEIRTLNKISPNIVAQIDSLCHLWASQNTREEGDFLAEREAIKRLIKNFNQLEEIMVLLYVDGNLKGFSANEIHGNGFASCLFEKALKSEDDFIYTYLINQTAKYLHKEGCQFISWMQDLGLAGLRQSKMSYHPVGFLKKYTVSNLS